LKKADLDWHDLAKLLHGIQPSSLEMPAGRVEGEADEIVRLGLAGATFFCSTKDIAYADVRVGEDVLTLPLAGRKFQEWLGHQYFGQKNKAPKLASERDAMRTLAAYARYQGGPRCEVHLRSARVGETLILDIGDETGWAIEVTAAGWHLLARSPVKFERMPGMAALPIPEIGGDIQRLRRFTNLSDSNFVLYVAALTDALFPGRPHVLLNLVGESGSGKTTAERIARSLTDPSEVPAGTLPRETRDLFADVKSSRVLCYDNVGDIPKRISDALCQITTGTGFRKRRLYTDSDQILVGGDRTVVFTSVSNPVVEPDLAERCVPLHVLHIAQRRSEARLWKDFERDRPAIFGALLDIVALGLKRLPQVTVPDPARLVDFVLWGVAIEQAFGAPGCFLAAFAACQTTALDSVIELNPVATAIAAFMEDKDGWDGTATELWRELKARDRTEARLTETKGWPKDPISFGIALAKSLPTLRKVGVQATRDRSTSRKRTPVVHLRRIRVENQPQQQNTAAEGSERLEGLNNCALAKIIRTPTVR
jgi:hypothetical protein